MPNFAVTFLALLAAVALVPSTTEAVCADADTNDIVSLACDATASPQFSSLCALLTSTGVGAQITRTSDFAVFAPTNTALINAGNTKGSLLRQQQAFLRYHIYPTAAATTDLVCGGRIDSLLTWNRQVQSSLTECSGTTLVSQNGDVTLPTINSGFAGFTTGVPIEACNGRIYSVDSALGFDSVQRRWQPRCSFNDPNCFGAKGSKAGPGFVVVDETVGDVTFQSIFYAGKGAKGFNRFNTRPFFNPNNNNPIQNNQLTQAQINQVRLNNLWSNRYGSKGGWRRQRQLERDDPDDADADAYDGGYDYASAARRAKYAEAEDYAEDEAEDY